MQSRALPEDFDMKQALHSPFGAAHSVGSALPTPTSYTPAFPEGIMIKPLNLDGLRRISDSSRVTSPTGITPSFGQFNITPPPSVTDTLSPVSATGDSSLNFASGLDNSQARNARFSVDVNTPGTFSSRPQNPTAPTA